MAHFQHEGVRGCYQARYCCRCIHGDTTHDPEGCAVMGLHVDDKIDEQIRIDKDEVSDDLRDDTELGVAHVLDWLISVNKSGRAERCRMFVEKHDA